ncbi:MAG TPA: TrkA C-terminal domain-containing protein [Sulfolobales archaeon]|nr:TrkA C-terminal domain-containing protein [Sulfolobales archaeon]
MGLARRALILCSGDESSDRLIDLLISNGYTVHILTNKNDAEKYLGKPVYIHLLVDGLIGEDLESVLGEVELAIAMSPNDDLNLSVGKILRSRGVPIVLAIVRSSEAEKKAESDGMIPINVARKILEELNRILKLRFAKIVLLEGSISVLSLHITSDSRLLGKTIREAENEYGISVTIIRGDNTITDPEQEIQQGDMFIAVGNIDKLRELLTQ